MIPDGVNLLGRKALVTAAPYVEVQGEPSWDQAHGLEIGDQVATVRRDGGNVLVMGEEASTPALVATDCLTLAPVGGLPEVPVGPDTAAHVLWHYRQIGYPPGSFTAALIAAIAAADPNNRRLLARAFPDYVRAVDIITGDPAGVDTLRHVMTSRHPL